MKLPNVCYERASLEVLRVPMLSDNYGWVLRDKASGLTAIVGPWRAGLRGRDREGMCEERSEGMCTTRA